jgi:hypothetical protein
VCDYVHGKADWLAHGLPREGEQAGVPYIGDLVDPDSPTCGPTDDAGVVRARIEGSRYDACLVVSGDRVLLGRVPASALESEDGGTAESLMAPGPRTVRANVRLPEIAKRMRNGDFETAIVTTPRGVLLGAVRQAAIEEVLRNEGRQ